MNRNVNSHFATNPTDINLQRSRFNRPSSVKLSFNVGDIIPFYVDEVLPGDTFNVKTSKVVRLQTLITPILDNIYLDTYYFYVPNRLVWTHWREFMGENTQSAWIPPTEYSVPVLRSPVSGGWSVGTIADYMGIPTGVSNLQVNALPFRAYALICNEWFRDQNLTDPLNIPVDDSAIYGVNTGNYITDVVKGGKPFKAAKYFDYFTACLPSPQKGPDVTLTVAEGSDLPVRAKSASIPNYSSQSGMVLYGVNDNPESAYSGYRFAGHYNDGSGMKNYVSTTYSGASDIADLASPMNLWAVNTGTAQVATINQLRLAFQIQKLYEKDARGGTRYIELLKSHFGVTSPDARMQRPEYLGGNRIPININQVIQQSATVEGSTPQGNVSGQSLTVDTHSDFTKSFVEHGFVIGLMVARYDHTYQQGLERFWSRRDRFDYYWPVLANIGEQAVLNKEIYATGTNSDNEVFGYNEAWADYRYKPNRVCGEMRSAYSASLDSWHLADDYDQMPTLSDAWIREDSSNVDRVLAVQSSVANQLFADVFIANNTTRPMPLYSVPGLIDHH